jgi:excisionase family DNA binding protein
MKPPHARGTLPTREGACPLRGAMGRLLTPNEAAARAGITRRTVMRAIEALHLPAHRDNKNAWKVDADALDAWRASVKPGQYTAPLTAPSTELPPGLPTYDAQANAHAAQVRELETERAALRVELRGLEVERDQLRERLAAAEALMRERVTEMQTQLHERLADAERRMHGRVQEAQVERDRALVDRDRMLALMERITLEASRPWLDRLLARFGRGRG